MYLKHLNWWMSVCAGFVFAFLAMSCSDQNEAKAVFAPVALVDAEEFGQSLEAALLEGDRSYFSGLIDMNRIANTAMENTGLSKSKKDSAKAGMMDALKSMGFFEQVHQVVEIGGSYEMLRARSQGDRTTVVMRLSFPDGGVNYHELYLINSGQGIRIEDIYVFLSGELITETMERVILQMLSRDKSFIERLQGKQSDMAKHMADVGQMTALMQAGEFERVNAIYQSLPKSIQNEKSMLLIQLSASQYTDEKLYLETIERFERHYPNDPSLNLVSIDGYAMREEYDKALACIDRLEKSLGGDEYLNDLRGNLMTLQGNFKEAEAIFLKQVEDDPNNPNGHWNMLTLKVTAKEFFSALKWMRILRDQHQVDFSQIESTDYYADFVKSPAYQVWISETQQ